MGFNKSFVVKNGIEVSTDLLVGEASLNNVGVGTTLPSTKLDVQGSFQASGTGRISGISTAETTFNVGVAGTTLHVDPTDSRIGIHTNITTNDITIVGHSTVTGNVHVTGFTTSDYLTVNQISTLNGLNVTGVSTIADVRVNAGFVTITQLTSTNSNVTGVSTVGGAVTMSSSGIDVNNIDVEALTGRGINISGDIDATGNIDAATYTGDGSAVTGIVTTLVAGPNISLDSGTGTVTITGLAKTDIIQADSLVVTGITTLGIVTALPSLQATNVYATKLYGDGSNLTGIDTSGNFQGKTVVCENVFASNPGVGTFGSVVINNPAGRITATEFYGNGANLTNTGSSLGNGSGVERLVTTALTSGTMTSSSTDPTLVYDFSNDRFGVGTNSPDRPISVLKNDEHALMRLENTGNGYLSGIELYRETSSGTGKGGAAIWVASDTSTTDATLNFSTNTNANAPSMTPKMVLNVNGRLGIGSLAPTEKLDIAGNVRSDGDITLKNGGTNVGSKSRNIVYEFSDGDGGAIGCRRESNQTSSDSFLYFRAGGSESTDEKMRLTAEGRLLIGSTSDEASLVIDNPTAAGVPSILISRSSNNANTSDIALTDNAVIRSEISLRSVVNDSGHFAWYVGGTDNKAGVSGATEKLRLTSGGKLRVPDNGKFTCGAGDDLQIFHDGSHSFIKESGTGNVIHEVTDATIEFKKGGSEHLAKFIPDGAVELYHNNSKKLETTSSGVSITGTLSANLTGDVTGDVTGDLSGTATNATNARIDSDTTTNADRFLVFVNTGGATNQRLKIDGNLKFNPSTDTLTVANFNGNATTASNADNAGLLDGIDSSAFLRSNTADTATSKITFNAGIRLNDEDKAEFGSSADYTIRHSGNNAIHNITTGDIYFQNNSSDKIYFDMSAGNMNPTTDNTGAVGTSGYTWNNGRFTNMTIDSTLSVRGAIDLADNDIVRFGSSDDAEFFTNGSHFYLDLNSGIGNFIIRDGTTTRFTFDDAGHFTSTGNILSSGNVQTDEVRNKTGSQLVLNAGESSGSATGQTAELVYINAEGGLQINSSPDNWSGGWNARHTATICNTSGNSTLPGDLTVNGDVTVTGDVNSTSDITFKENISVIDGAMDLIQQLEGVAFGWRENKKSSMGVIAQTVEKVIPELVDENDEGVKSVKYNGLVGVLIEAVKELSSKVNDLEGKLNK